MGIGKTEKTAKWIWRGAVESESRKQEQNGRFAKYSMEQVPWQIVRFDPASKSSSKRYYPSLWPSRDP